MNDKVVLENTNLIYHTLKKMGLYEQHEEYFDLGMIGLIKGVKTYNPIKHTALSTYLCKCIKNEILMYRREQRAKKRGYGIKMVSLETPIKNDEDKPITLADVIADKRNTEEEIIKKQLLLKVDDEIDKLNETDRFIVCSTFGIRDMKKLTQKQIAAKINTSQVYISRRLQQIYKKIRRQVGGDE